MNIEKTNEEQQWKPKPKGPWVKSTARVAGPRKRHMILVSSFLFMVLLPIGLVYIYLWYWANDQYASEVGFTIRSEEARTAMDLLGGLTNISSSSGDDSRILYEYIQSQHLVRLIDKKLDLRKIYSKAKGDPIYNFDTTGTIEDLTRYWLKMVKIHHDSGGFIGLRVLAFDPEDARRIAAEIVKQCSIKINQLSAISRNDATSYARTELNIAVSRLKNARAAVTTYRNKYQIVDPSGESQSKLGVLSSLQQGLSEAYIELDLLTSTTGKTDPRVKQAHRKINVIKERIHSERTKVGLATDAIPEGFSVILAEFEGLTIDLEYAQQSYLSALTALDTAQANAARKSRYLATYIEPTLAEKSEYPKRLMNISLVGVFLFLFWSLLILVYFSIRDRR